MKFVTKLMIGRGKNDWWRSEGGQIGAAACGAWRGPWNRRCFAAVRSVKRCEDDAVQNVGYETERIVFVAASAVIAAGLSFAVARRG